MAKKLVKDDHLDKIMKITRDPSKMVSGNVVYVLARDLKRLKLMTRKLLENPNDDEIAKQLKEIL